MSEYIDGNAIRNNKLLYNKSNNYCFRKLAESKNILKTTCEHFYNLFKNIMLFSLMGDMF